MTYVRALLIVILVGLVGAFAYLEFHNPAQPVARVSSPQHKSKQTILPSPDEASSLWVVVNKGRALPGGYVPQPLRQPNIPIREGTSDERYLRSDAAESMEEMFASASLDGISLMLASGYRSYSLQQQIYASYAKMSGAAVADTYSAHAGFSEHQTGLAADIEPASRNCEVSDCFGQTPEGSWIKENSYKFGFIVRYTEDNQDLTGYIAEPWHIRYIGKDLASQLQSSGQTPEQYFKLPAYTTYALAPFQLR